MRTVIGLGLVLVLLQLLVPPREVRVEDIIGRWSDTATAYIVLGAEPPVTGYNELGELGMVTSADIDWERLAIQLLITGAATGLVGVMVGGRLPPDADDQP